MPQRVMLLLKGKKMRTRILSINIFSVALISCLFIIQDAIAENPTPSLSINSDGALIIKDSEANVTDTLLSGTIGKTIQVNEQQFKVSYGRNLREQISLIIYPDPAAPQSLSLNVLNQPVSVSKDSVLTITAAKNLSVVNFQSGLLGTVSVAGSTLTDGNTMQVQGEQKVHAGRTSATVTQAPTQQKTSLASDTYASTRQVSSLDSSTPDSTLTSKFEANAKNVSLGNKALNDLTHSEIKEFAAQEATNAVVREVEGEVMIAPAGTNLIELLRTAITPPLLKPGDRIPAGSTVQTGPNSKAMISPFPGAVIAMQSNTSLTLEACSYTKSSNGPRHIAHIYLASGGAVHMIKGLDPDTVNYVVRTSLANVQAVGTVFGTWASQIRSIVVAQENAVRVETAEGIFLLTLVDGNKVVITRESTAEDIEVINASAEELEAFIILLAQANSLLNLNDINPNVIIDPVLEDQIANIFNPFNQVFNPQLNNAPMTPIFSP